jgi:hypothetical protein
MCKKEKIYINSLINMYCVEIPVCTDMCNVLVGVAENDVCILKFCMRYSMCIRIRYVIRDYYFKILLLQCYNNCIKFNEVFSGKQPHQDAKVVRHYSVWLLPHYQGVAGGMAELKLITRCPTLCCVYLCWIWVQDGLWPVWLVGTVKSSWHLPGALCYWLCRAFCNRQPRPSALTSCLLPLTRVVTYHPAPRPNRDIHNTG